MTNMGSWTWAILKHYLKIVVQLKTIFLLTLLNNLLNSSCSADSAQFSRVNVINGKDSLWRPDHVLHQRARRQAEDEFGGGEVEVWGPFTVYAHGVQSSDISLQNGNMIHVPNLHYDGLGPRAYFFLGKGSAPLEYPGDISDIITEIPDENGNAMDPLKAYSGESIMLQIPEGVDYRDYDWFAIFCTQFRHMFAYVLIPSTDGPSSGQPPMRMPMPMRSFQSDGGRGFSRPLFSRTREWSRLFRRF